MKLKPDPHSTHITDLEVIVQEWPYSWCYVFSVLGFETWLWLLASFPVMQMQRGEDEEDFSRDWAPPIRMGHLAYVPNCWSWPTPAPVTVSIEEQVGRKELPLGLFLCLWN